MYGSNVGHSASSLQQVRENVRIEHVFLATSDEPLAISVLIWLAWLDVVDFHDLTLVFWSRSKLVKSHRAADLEHAEEKI